MVVDPRVLYLKTPMFVSLISWREKERHLIINIIVIIIFIYHYRSVYPEWYIVLDGIRELLNNSLNKDPFRVLHVNYCSGWMSTRLILYFSHSFNGIQWVDLSPSPPLLSVCQPEVSGHVKRQAIIQSHWTVSLLSEFPLSDITSVSYLSHTSQLRGPLFLRSLSYLVYGF